MPRTRLAPPGLLHTLACALALTTPSANAEDWQPAKGLLTSRWARDVSPTNALVEYPRPHMARTRWQNLDGLWDYRITPSGETGIPHDHDGKILVPFCIEAPLSGVMKPLKPDQRLWYQREFTIPAGWDGQRVLLHFGAVDWETTVFVDGHRLGTHRGGYDGFSFDLTKHLGKGPAHTLAVSVWDPTDGEGVLHGKQTLHPGGCSYTAVSGIWQTVWLEPVPLSAIDDLAVVPDLEAGRLRVTVSARVVPRPLRVHAILSDQGKVVAEASGGIGDELTRDNTKNMVDFFKATSAEISAAVDLRVPTPRAWSP